MTKTSAPAKAHCPQAYTVFGAAIVAGVAVAFGLNSALDSHLAQAKPQVESESILVALRPLPAGSPVTVWDVGLRDWPKAMVPSTAMRVTDDLDNLVVRHPLREGQPILAVQLGRVDTAGEAIARPLAVAAPPAPSGRELERDLWEKPPAAPA
ncbi:MAG: SAF domain-containing protein, partial [Planctomycetia bacterium]